MPDNDFTDFMLKEYECLAQAFFESREVLTKWFKYYLLVMAVPFSFFAILYKDKPKEFNIYLLPETLSILLTIIGLIGLFITFVMIHADYDSVLYARSVNGVRNYFSVIENSKNNNDPAKTINGYLVLPTTINFPPYVNNLLTWIVVSAALINSFYLCLGVTQISQIRLICDKCVYQWAPSLIVFITVFIIHMGYYLITARSNEKGLKV